MLFKCVNITDQPSRNAGHSKWQNIKNIKGIKDMEKSKDITKFSSMVQIAVKGKTIHN